MTPTEPDFPPKGSLLTQQEAIYAKCTDNLLTIGAFCLFDFREKVLLFRGAGRIRTAVQTANRDAFYMLIPWLVFETAPDADTQSRP